MLMECSNCGAPLDVTGSERLARCKYCGTTSRLRALRTVASETPPGWRPPEEWTPPAEARADSRQPLTYHPEYVVQKAARWVVWLVVLCVLVPVVASAVVTLWRRAPVESVARLERMHEELLAGQQGGPPPQAREQRGEHIADQVGEALEAADLSPLSSRGAQHVYRAVVAKLGAAEPKLRRITLHSGHASMSVQSPDDPQHVDEYRYRDGMVTGPDPVRLSSRDRKEIGASLFSPGEVSLGKLSELIADGPKRLGYEGGEVSHVIIERGLPFHAQVVIRVYVRGPRDSGRAEYLGDGRLRKLYR